ncbi:hypothetical protein NC652_025297 [Populus alba x Populus x berolinensis]|nr:hypothetical protein NC652_025297 [Populus alba x Populus x berolinensis]
MQESLLFVEEWEKLLCFTIPFLREVGFSRKTSTLAQWSQPMLMLFRSCFMFADDLQRNDYSGFWL